MRRHSILALILLLATPAASATEAFKCTAADGSISFQDRPCGDSTRERQFRLPEYAPPPAAMDDASIDATPPPAENPVPSASAAPREPPPSFFLCTRYDGSRYLNDTGIGSSRWVPLDLIHSNRDLASAYGGPNGIGVSAPGLGEPPHVASAFGGISYVRWDDQCHHAAPQEACAWLRDELDRVRGQLRRAFSDTEAQLKQQERELRERRRGC